MEKIDITLLNFEGQVWSAWPRGFLYAKVGRSYKKIAAVYPAPEGVSWGARKLDSKLFAKAPVSEIYYGYEEG